MTSTRLLTLALCSTLVLAGCFGAAPDNGEQSSSNDSIPELQMSYILLQSPLPGDVVTNPLIVSGSARGTWYFEASFPVRLLDGNGNEIAITPAQAQGDWMTEDFVPFSAVLQFNPPVTLTGTLILQKDNPSGMPENDASIQIPVLFQ